MNAGNLNLFSKYPNLRPCQNDIIRASEMLVKCFQSGNKLLICGNGGSAADSEHIVAELMKSFLIHRPVDDSLRQKLSSAYPNQGDYIFSKLQGSLPAISLVSQSAFITAYSNDVAPDMVFAQQVYGYGVKGDVLLSISTSGNSKNVIHALQVARVIGVQTIGLTGRDGGKMTEYSDVSICSPYDSTLDIQESHLAIYHTLCKNVEEMIFG